MISLNTDFAFRMREGTRLRALDQFRRNRIDEGAAAMDEEESVFGDVEQSFFGEMAGSCAGSGAEEGKRNAILGAQAEGDSFEPLCFIIKGLGFCEGVADGLDLRHVAGGIGEVFGADGIER